MREVELGGKKWWFDEKLVLGKPGSGGTVYGGKDSEGNLIAIKRFNQYDRAGREVEIAASLIGQELPHVIPIYAAGEDAQTAEQFVVMARADSSLADLMEKKEALSEAEALDILDAILAGLQELETIVHRDLKPANVLSHNGVWKLCDFGISRSTNAKTAEVTFRGEGTAEYAPPEVWRFESANSASDIYSWACIAFELVNGKPPFTEPNIPDKHKLTPAPDSVGSPKFVGLLHDCLSKERDLRPSLVEVRNRLTSLKRGERKPLSPRLAELSAKFAAEESAAQSARAAERDKKERRDRLAAGAAAQMHAKLSDFLRDLHDEAPGAKISEASLSFGKGTFQFYLTTDAVREGAFSQSRWDVVCGGHVHIRQTANRTGYVGRSSSLWYAKPPDSADYSWYEMSYWRMGGFEDGLNIYPMAMGSDDVAKADEALSPVMGVFNLAFKPKLLNEEGFEQFRARWTRFLESAAEGAMTSPSQMPEEQ